MAQIPTVSIRETASASEVLAWARSCNPGDYLAIYARGEDEQDPKSLCGYSETVLDDVRRVLRDRGMRLDADDSGLRATVREVAS